jgi:hypothetical protein
LTIDGICLLSSRRRSEKHSRPREEAKIKMPHEIIFVDCGDDVLCDFCNGDYTKSEETGGCQVGSYAICPKCAKKLEAVPDQRAAKNETFRDFVYRLRR